MCGIIYFKRTDGKPARKSVRKRFNQQKTRGQSGFGYVAVKDNKIVAYERAATEHEIMLKLMKEDAPEILFHHRFPTSTPNMEEQAHPLLVDSHKLDHQYYFAHNGVIANPLTRKEEHTKLGIEYSTLLTPLLQSRAGRTYVHGLEKFNDSEALAVDTALVLDGKANRIPSEGAAAVVGFKVKDGMVVERFFYRNSANPLKYEKNKAFVSLTSNTGKTDVPSIYLMHLNDAGEMERNPTLCYTPWSYSAPTTMGYVKYARNWDLPTIEAGDDHILTLPEPAHGPTEDDIDAESAADQYLRGMTTVELWKEYNRMHGAIDSIKKNLALLEDVATRDPAKDPKMEGTRKKIQKRIDDMTEYDARLSTELTVRESMENIERNAEYLTG